MPALIAQPLDPRSVAQLSNIELEQELTLATLTTAREQHYEVLLHERRRRRQNSGELEPQTA